MPSTSVPRTLLTLVVLACVCTGSVTAAVGPDTAAVGSEPAPKAADAGCFPGVDHLDRGEAVGDVVDVEMLLCFRGSVTVAGPGYTGTATLGDGNGSGDVTLRINTGRNGVDAFSVTSETLDSVPMNATGNGTFRPGTYTVTVRDGSGDVVDTASFELGQPRARNLTVFRAPRDAASDLQSVEAVRTVRSASRGDSARRLDDPNMTDHLRIAANETLVVAVRADGLEGAMADAEGTPLSRFRQALREQDGSLSLRQTDETVTPSREPLTPDVLNSSATHLVADPANDSYYLVVDTERLWGEWAGSWGGPVRIGSYVGSGYAVQFSINGSLDQSLPADRVGADFRVVEPAMEYPRYSAESRARLPAGNITVAGRTTVSPGTTLTATVSGIPNGSIERTVRVQRRESGPGVRLALDLSGVPTGTNLTVTFERDGAPIEGSLAAVVDASVAEETDTERPTASPTATPSPTATSTPAGSESGPTDRSTTTESIPGFGVVATLSGLLIVARWLGR